MEIKTTIIRFKFPKNRIISNDKAHCFLLGSIEDAIKCWIPKVKVNIEEHSEDMFKVSMPKWVFNKTALKPYTETEEDVITFTY